MIKIVSELVLSKGKCLGGKMWLLKEKLWSKIIFLLGFLYLPIPLPFLKAYPYLPCPENTLKSDGNFNMVKAPSCPLHSCLFVFGLSLDIPVFLKKKKKKSLYYLDYKNDTCLYYTINTIGIKEKMQKIPIPTFHSLKMNHCECFGGTPGSGFMHVLTNIQPPLHHLLSPH